MAIYVQQVIISKGHYHITKVFQYHYPCFRNGDITDSHRRGHRLAEGHGARQQHTLGTLISCQTAQILLLIWNDHWEQNYQHCQVTEINAHLKELELLKWPHITQEGFFYRSKIWFLQRETYLITLGSRKAKFSPSTCKYRENLSASVSKAAVAYARAMIFSILLLIFPTLILGC